MYTRVVSYARKRTHFQSGKEQGEIPVTLSDRQKASYTRVVRSAGHSYRVFATLADQDIAKPLIICGIERRKKTSLYSKVDFPYKWHPFNNVNIA